MERDFDLQKNPKLVLIPKKKTQWKKLIMMKDEKNEKNWKNIWVAGEALHFIVLRGELKLEFPKNAKNKVNFIVTHLFYFQL
jgi:hypothetical protein